MKTTVDKAGRLVIPRELRNRIGLGGGGEVELVIEGAAIRVEPVAGADLVEEDGFLVVPATGLTFGHDLVRELIDDDRHARG